MSAPSMRLLQVLANRRETATCRTLVLSGRIGFLPGQFLNLYLDSLCRSYTIASPPGAPVEITYRIKGDFTRRLARLRKGARIRALGPLGKFVFKPSRRAVLISGGIGIAGFVSAIRSAAKKSRIKLIHSERDAGDEPFLGELARAPIELIRTYTGTPPRGWTGLTGRLGRESLAGSLNLEERKEAVFYICGSDGFVKEIAKALRSMRIPSARIRTEGFGK